MKQFWIAFSLLLTIAGCTAAQTDRFVASVGNFNRGVAAVDASIGALSATLYSNCKNLQSVGQAAVDVTGTCNKASPVVNAVNDVINGYCQSSQVTNISSAVATTANTITATKSQLSAAKQACANGAS